MEDDTSATDSSVQRANTTTTISTIAVQSGETRIVIALLQSKEWMQLKVQEMQPAITDIGSCLEDAMMLHQQHEQVLEKLQSKQSPVEELLRQADELISTQQPRAEVYAAMAENLGLAWKDLNNQLEQRRQILEQAVTFHSRVRDFTERMDKAHVIFTDTYSPNDIDSCKMLLQRLHDDKKGILEISLHTLNAGQILVHQLDEIAHNSLNDSRPEHMKIEAQKSSSTVERMMENLHDRWRYLEGVWQSRKTKLEHTLQILLVSSDLDQVENWLQTKGAEYMRQYNLGDSSANAEILLHEHGKVEIETKEVQDRCIRLLKTVEQLTLSGVAMTETSRCRAYQLLSDCSDLISAVHTRRQLLSLAIAFFNLCQTVVTKLDQLDVQLSTTELLPNATNQIKRTINELVTEAVAEGQNLIEMAENVGTEGVQRKIAELEDRRQHLLKLCSSVVTPESNTAYINFHNRYDTLYTWITSTVQAFLQGHQDMGSSYPMAKNFLESHESLQKEIRLKDIEVDALLKTVPSLVRVGGKEAEEVHKKADNLRSQWTLLLSLLDNRILIVQRYAAFHKLASQLGTDMESIENVIQSDRDGSNRKETEEKWFAVQQQFLELNNKGKNFIEDAYKVNDPHLDIKRAILCVQTILDQFNNRKNNINNLWNSWQQDVISERQQLMQWEYCAKEIRRVVEVVTTFKLQLYPIIPKELNRIDSIIVFLERHQENMNGQIKSLGREIEDCLNKSQAFSTKGEFQNQKDQLLNQMKNAQNELEAKLTECLLLAAMMLTFFQNLKQIEEKNQRQDPVPTDISSIDQQLADHDNLRPTFLQLLEFAQREADQLINKINEIEPPPAAAQDKEKIQSILLWLHQQLEDSWKLRKERLEQQKFYWQLREINQQIQELSDQLSNMKGNTGESLATVKLTSQAFIQLQKTIELLDEKVNTFVSTAQRMVAPPMQEISELQTKWSTFHMQIGDTREHIDLVLEYFVLIEQIEEWFKEGSQLLVSIAQRSASCKNPTDAINLQNEVDRFVKPGEAEQDKRMKKLSTLSIQLYGQAPPITNQILQKNKDMLTSFVCINKDLKTLQQNLNEAEKQKQKLEKEAVKEVQVDIVPDPTRPPVFTVPLMDVEVTEGSKVTFLCHVDGHPPPFIEWLKDGLQVHNNPDYQTKYENGLCTLTIEETFAEDSAKYICRATNSVGRAETQGQLTVRESHPHEEAIPPHFVKEPALTVARQGQPCQMECQVEGNPLPVVSWYKNDVCIDNFPEYVITYNNGYSILRFEEIYPEDEARYTCKAVNPAGQVACSVKLTVLPQDASKKPEIIVPLSNVMARAGQKLRLECKVDGLPTPTITWYHNRQPVSDFCQTSYSDGIAILVIPEAFPKDAGTYSLVASNEVGETSSSCLVSVKGRLPLETSDSEMASDFELLKPDVRLHLQNQTVIEGNPIRLDCVIIGQPEPEVIWYHNGKPVKESEDVQLLFEGDRCSLIIKEAYLEDQGCYKCVAINSAGEASSICELKVKPFQNVVNGEKGAMEIGSPPMFSLMLRNVMANEEESVKMACQVKGQPDPEISWYRNGVQLHSSAHCVITKEPSGLTTLTISTVEKGDEGEYMVKATNNAGEAKCIATLSVLRKPGIPPCFQKYLDCLTVEKEREAKFQCQITGTPKPEVQWYFGEILIKSDKFQTVSSDGDHHSLTIAKCLPFHAGRYTVKAENDSGRAVSSATLNIIEPAPSSPEMQEHRAQTMVMTKKTTLVQKSTICQPAEKFIKGSYEILQTSEEEVDDKPKKSKVEITLQSQSPDIVTSVLPLIPPKFLKPLQSIIVKSGFRLQMEAEVTGQPEPQVEWYRNGVKLKNSPDFRITSIGNVHQLLIPEVFPDDSGTFQITATNSCGEATSTADLIVEEESNNGTTQRVAVVEERKELFTKISLKKTESEDVGMISEVKIWSGAKPTPYPAPLLVTLIKDVEPEEVSNNHRRRETERKTETDHNLSDVTVDQGVKVTLVCHVTGSPQPNIKWFREHQQITSSKDYEMTYRDGECCLIIPEAFPEDQGSFTCSATNIAGTKSTSAKLIVRNKAAAQQITRTERVDVRTIRQPIQQRYTQIERQVQDGIQFQRSVSSDYDGEPGSPLYYSGTEQGFRVDTFEYRLLREVEFRESLIQIRPEEMEQEVYDQSKPPSAPQIAQRPRNSKLLEGSDVTFQAKISGNPKPRIIWFKNGQRLLPSQRYKMSFVDNVATLNIHMALPEDAGFYTLLAENKSGRITCSAHLVIEAIGVTSETKFISTQRFETAQQQQQVQHYQQLQQQQMQQQYQQQQMQQQYQQQQMQQQYQQQYQQIDTSQTRMTQVENEVDSGARTLKPNFVKVPTDKEITEGKMVRFDCRVSGRPFPEVLWYKNGIQIMDDATHKLLVNEGGVHALMITVASREDSGHYVCVARNKSGEAKFEVNLHIIEKEQVVSPKFVERFQSIHVRDGEPVTLHCRAVGTPIPRITWQKDGVQIHSRPPDMIIETMDGSSTLYFNKVTYLDAGWYQCTAQNQAGSTATRARLYVEIDERPLPEPWRLHLPRPHKVIEPERSPPRETIWLRPVERAAPYMPQEEERRPTQKPAFTTHLQNLNLQEGDRANFDCRLIPIGDPTMNIEWFVNGRPIEAGSRVMTTYRFGYVALTLLHVYAEDSGVYMCRATNEAGEATTTATLRCTARVAIDREAQHPESIEAIQHLEDWEHYKKDVTLEETVSVQKPVFIKPLRNLENLQEGGFAHFEAQITPVNDPTMKIEWLFNGQPLTAGSRISTIFSFGYVALNISYLRAEDSGLYVCKATNQKGEAMSTASLKVKVSGFVVSDLGIPEQEKYIEKIQELESYQYQQRHQFVEVDAVPQQKPSFRTQLNDQKNIQQGRTAHFEARLEPTGDSTMRVEWLKDGKPLEASSRITAFFNFGYVSLTIRNVDTRDIGTYTCCAINSMGTATTKAVLTCITKKSVVLESQYPEGLEKIQHLEDYSRYQRETYEETTFTQRPSFTQPLHCQEHIVEGQSAHFETRLEPMGDPSMTVEWYFNGKPLTTGLLFNIRFENFAFLIFSHRFKTYFDFGYVALDILYVFREDTGTFTVKAKNAMGETTLSKSITVQAKSDVDTSTIHEIGMEKIEYLERAPFQEPQYNIEEISKSKPHFIIPLHDPKPVREGDRIHMECRLEPSTDPTMKVEWFFNGKPLMIGHRFQTYYDFGFVALDILTAYPEDTGEYTVRATNHLGSAHTSACVRVQARSSIISETQHPEGLEKIQHLEDASRFRRDTYEETVITQIPTFTKALHNIETIEGTNIHLECRLTPIGDPSMKVEWFVNGLPLKVGHRFRPAHEFDYVALDILSIYAEDSGVYTCKATNSLGQAVTSCSVKCIAKSEIILETQHPEGLEKIQYLEDTSRYRKDVWVEESVKIRPKFVTKLNNLALREGQLAHFECRLEPINDNTLKVEWFHNGKSLPVGHRYRPFHDFGYVALNILSVVPEDSGTYTCRATNIMGSEEITATLTCQGKSSIIVETQHPEGLEKIQQLEDYSRYTRLTTEEEICRQAPVFTSAPQSIEIKEGQRAHFECRLIPVGDPKLKVEWFHNGIHVKTGTRFVETLSFGFVALDIMCAYPEDSGTYTCKATNALGEAVVSVHLKCYSKSSLILESQQPESLEKIQALEVSGKYRREEIEELTTQAPVFTQPMRNLQLIENQSAHFECRLIPVGDPKLKVEWFHNGKPLMKATRVTTTHDFGFVALDLSYVKTEDSGTYTCKARNELGEAVCSATLVVKATSSLLMETQHPEGLEKIQYLEDTSRYKREVTEEGLITSKPIFITPLTGRDKLIEGQSSHLECRVEPYPDPTMKIEWFFNGKPLQTGHRFRTRCDFGFVALDILTVYAEDSGEYMVRATNQVGTATSSAKITVTAKKSLILESQQPDSLQKIEYLEGTRYKQMTEQEIIYNQKPAFGRPLNNLDNLIESQSAHLEATLTPTNDPNMKVEWFFNGRPIQQGHRFKTTFDFGYVALDIMYVYSEDSGTYMCKATNLVGEAVTTCSIQVKAKSTIYTETYHEEGLEKIRKLEETYVEKVEEQPILKQRPVFITPLNSLDNIKEGQPAHLECRLQPVNDPNLRVEWYVNGIEIKTAHRFRTTHDFGYVALDILYCYPEDSGTYMCKAVNELGEAVTTCTIKVQARRSIYYDTQHPEGLEKIRELECQTRYETIEIEERPICKPYFTTQLRGLTELTEGQSAHLECQVEPAHDSQLKIEFFHNGKPLEAASRFHITFDFGYVALDISHILPEDEGTYTVKATNTLGEAVSSITIRIHSKSGIISETQHPEGLAKIQALEEETGYKREVYIEPRTCQRPVFTAPLQNLDNLIEGQSAHMECRLIPVGDPTLKVEWFFNNEPLQPGSRFQTIHDFGYVALDIQYVRPDDTGVYMCRASNELGEAVTTASIKVKSKATIELQTQHPEGLEKIQRLESDKEYRGPEAPETVYEKPVFTKPLTGPRELVEGQAGHFECYVIPVGDPNLYLEWYVNGIELKMGSRYKVTHDFGMVNLDIASVIPEDSGVYMCKAINKAGEAVTTTSLKVKARHSILSESQYPEAFEKTRKFEYDAEPKISETWVDIVPPRAPFFTQHLTNIDRIMEGQYIHLEARVEPTNDEKLKIEWYKNGKQLILGTRIRTTFDFGYVTLDIISGRPDDSGIYTCRAVNEVGEAISTCTIKVEGRESILLGSQHPESLPKIQELESVQLVHTEYPEAEYEAPVFITHLNDLELREGESAHFECQVEPSRDPTLTIEFLVNGKVLPAATKFTVKNDFGFITLDISYVITEDSGIYTCRATNNKGQAVTTGSLKVHGKDDIIYATQHPMGQEGLSKVREVDQAYMTKYQVPYEEAEIQYPKPVFVVPLQANFTVNEGEGLRLECRVEPAADPKLGIEWYFNGKPLSLGSRFMFTNDFGQVVMDISDLWPRDCGVYTCRAFNKQGEAFTTTTITCISKSTIYEGTLHPEGEKGLESIQVLEEALIRQVDVTGPEEVGQPPVFTSRFENLTNLTEGDIAHFEATLTPAGDQTMVVEWFFKGEPLKVGHRIRTVHAFGMVVLEILGVYPEDTGEYTCRATNKWGYAEITVNLECVDIARGQKPRFTTQLQSLVGLKEGESAHFECTLIPVGDPHMRVEWFHNGQPLRHSSRIKTLSDFGYVVMDISFVHVEDSGEYVCVATNKFGSDTTRCIIECSGHGKIFRESLQPQSLEKIAKLEGSYTQYRSQISVEGINQPPKFETQIQPLPHLVEGQSAHFEAQLTPINDPNMKVEWFFNGKLLSSGHRFRTFHDFGIVILDLLYCYAEDSGEYMCKATNRLGTDITKTTLICKSKSSIILDPQLPPEMAGGNERIMQLEESLYRSRREYVDDQRREAPRFTVPLENLSNLREGENAHLEARLIPTDDPELRVEWFRDGKPLRAGTRIRPIHDFGFVVLEISPVYPEDSGLYSCRATNRVGEAVTTCTVKCEGKRSIILETQLPEGMETGIEKIAKFEEISDKRLAEQWMDVDVSQPPKFLTPIEDQTLPENALAHFECRLVPTNDPSMRVEWFHNGKPLITGSRVKTISDFGFVILEIAGVYSRDSGTYTCKAINKIGEATVSAKLTIKVKQSVIMEPQLPHEWRSGTESLQKLEESMYQTKEVIYDEGAKMPPHFITQIQDLVDKVEGDSARFDCRLEPVGDPHMKVEWFLNGKPLTTGTRVHTVDDFGFVVLEIDWLFPRDSGEYLCRATNKYGSDTTKAVLKIKSKRDIIMDSQLPEGMSAEKLRDLEYPPAYEAPSEETPLQPPRFVTQIQPQENLHEGDSVHFECRLEPINDPKLRVEWYHNGQPLRSGHRFKTTHDFGFVALDILYVYAEDSGEYVARAVNELGEDTTKTTLKCKGKPPLIYGTQLPKEMESGVQKIAEMEASWQRVEYPEDVPQERAPPVFVMKPEPQNVVEGEWAKFCCRVTGYPRPRIMWVLNGNTVVTGSRYKLTYDGIYHLDIPKARQYDQGKVEVYARNAVGEACCWTTLEVRPRHDDYRLVLKNSPRPWYDSEIRSYQHQRQECELEDVFEEKLTPGGTRIDVWHTEESEEGDHIKGKKRLEEEELKKLQPEVKRYKSEAIYYDEKTGEKRVEQQSQVQYMAKTYESQIDSKTIQFPQPPPTSPESTVYGKEVHVSKQKQTQKEVQGDLEITRHTTVTETVEQEHKAKTKERKVAGPVPESKSPVFTKKIQPCRVFEGESGKFECIFTGTPTPNITWFRENFPIQNSKDFQITTTDKKSTLVIREVYLEDSGVFSVKAENRGGSAKSSANLVVEERKEQKRGGVVPPNFNRTIQSCSTKSGQLVRLDAKVSGSKPFDVYWLKNGKKVVPDITHKLLEEDDLYTLLILEAVNEDAGSYECVAINKAGEARCQANVIIESPTKPKAAVSKDQGKESKVPEVVDPLKDLTVKEGQSAVFQCKISGTPAPQVKWYRGDTLVKQSRYFRMSTEKDIYSLRISEAFPEDEGVYKCVASNSAGMITTSANLKVIVPESTEVPPSLNPLADLKVPEGTPARFVTSVTGTPTPKITWYREGAIIKPTRDFQMFQDGGSCSLVIRQTFPEDEGIYTCRATNASGQAETSARLTVERKPTGGQKVPAREGTQEKVPKPKDVKPSKPSEKKPPTEAVTPPRFVKEPKPIVSKPGTKVTFECRAEGNPEPKLMWYYKNSPIQSSKDFRITHKKDGTSTLEIKKALPGDAGVYKCKATNRIGSAVTESTLTVRETGEPPKFTVLLKPTTTCEGKTITLSCVVKGNPKPEITWYHNKEKLQPSRDFQITHKPESGLVTLTIPEVFPDDDGIFHCKAVNCFGEDETSAKLTVTEDIVIIEKTDVCEPPRFVKPLLPKTAPEGEPVEMSVEATGVPTPALSWLVYYKTLYNPLI
ncbi:titin [Centruroides vittatus]|uniref:titin n=1 Tax=Centruroides vittatus TaxID=120091 RepID=UPI003510C80B